MRENYPRPPWWRLATRAEVDELHRAVIADNTMTDQLAGQLERRVIALEEIVAARWPRRIVVRRRLRRDLRRSVAHVQGATFTERRIEAIGSGWIRPLPATGRQRTAPPATHEAAPSRASLRGAFTRSTGRHR